MTPSAAALTRHMAPHGARSRRFKVAVFSYGLPNPGTKRGGIEQVAHDLANALADRGHDITVFTYDARPERARYATAPLPGRWFVQTRIGRPLAMGYIGNFLALAPGYRDFDLVLAHGDSLLLPLLGKPVIRVMHGSALEEARSAVSLIRKLLMSGVYLQELATAWLQQGTVGVSANTGSSNPFIHRTIPNGIDLQRFRPHAARRSTVPILLFVGALNGRKRGAWLAEQFTRHIRPHVPNAELHLVTANGPAIDGGHYHPGISTDALVELYQRAWIYTSPSTYEGFGLPYAEALACGAPVVATPNPGSREVLANGRYGYLVSDESFAPTVLRLIHDRAERDAMTRLGLERAAEYDITRTAAAYESLIEALVP